MIHRYDQIPAGEPTRSLNLVAAGLQGEEMWWRAAFNVAGGFEIWCLVFVIEDGSLGRQERIQQAQGRIRDLRRRVEHLQRPGEPRGLGDVFRVNVSMAKDWERDPGHLTGNGWSQWSG